MKNKIQLLFIVLIIALISSVCVWGSELQLENDKIESQNVKANAQTTIQNSIGENALNKTEFHFLDVGQGDSTLIIFPNGKTMLIDAGKSNYGYTVVNYIKNLKISKIDYLVMTHPDADHIGGMTSVLDNFEIGAIYMPDKISTTKTFEDLLLKIMSKGLKITVPKSNDLISESTDFKAIVLSPTKKYDDSNEMSIVIKIIYKNNSFILMGDAGNKVENDLLYSNANIKSDLIKIGHHGSSSSSSTRFIEKVDPQFAIISCGKNNQYGHPNSKTLETLNKNGIKIYRTDELGNIIAISDGNTINVNN